MNKNQTAICQLAIDTYGIEHQQFVLQEELAELIQAISKVHRKDIEADYNNLIEEIADVIIMIKQMSLIYGNKPIDDAIDKKLNRLEQRIKERK